jgi:hypothetical protein
MAGLPRIPERDSSHIWAAFDQARERRRLEEERALQRNAMMDFAANPEAGLDTALRTGQLDTYQTLNTINRQRQSAEQSSHAQNIEVVISAADEIEADMAKGIDPLESFKRLAPGLKYRGADDNELSMFAQHLQQDPVNFLRAVRDKAAEIGPKVGEGFEYDPQAKRARPIPGGRYDPEYIAEVAGVRRNAITSQPMPSRARAGGGGRGRRRSRGGGSIPPPPPGFVLE